MNNDNDVMVKIRIPGDIMEMKDGTKYIVDKHGSYVNIEKKKKRLKEKLRSYEEKISKQQ